MREVPTTGSPVVAFRGIIHMDAMSPLSFSWWFGTIPLYEAVTLRYYFAGFLSFMIVGAVIISWLVDNPVPMKPLMVSKLNTVAQVAFAALVLASLGFGFSTAPYEIALMLCVTVLTLLSVSFYLVEWARHMSAGAPTP